MEVCREPGGDRAHAVDADAVGQRADGLAVADVDPDVAAVAPHHEITGLRVAPAGETAGLEVAVQRACRAKMGSSDPCAVAGLAEGIDDESGAIEPGWPHRA